MLSSVFQKREIAFCLLIHVVKMMKKESRKLYIKLIVFPQQKNMGVNALDQCSVYVAHICHRKGSYHRLHWQTQTKGNYILRHTLDNYSLRNSRGKVFPIFQDRKRSLNFPWSTDVYMPSRPFKGGGFWFEFIITTLDITDILANV